MTASAILERLNSLGVITSVDGGMIRLTPASRIPADLKEAIRTHKKALMLALRPPEPLRHALTQKDEEIATMRRRLASTYYADDPQYQEWGRSVIGCLQAHSSETQRYLRDGGALALPRCCIDPAHVCLIALRRFDGCLMGPGECGFSWREGEC